MPARPGQAEWPAIFDAMHTSANAIGRLSPIGRNTVLCSLLTMEVCRLPPGDRQAALGEIIADLPIVLRSTEEGMRLALSENARDGL